MNVCCKDHEIWKTKPENEDIPCINFNSCHITTLSVHSVCDNFIRLQTIIALALHARVFRIGE